MRKNKMMRLASGLLVAVLLTTCVISGTFAKYVAEISGDDEARVAKFEVVAFGETIDAQEDTVEINIFQDTEVYDTKDADYDAGVNDADIKDGTGETIIAPGSWGTFSFDVQNKSEVTVKYTIDYNVTEAGVPLEWSLDGDTWTDDLADVAETTLAIGSAATTVDIYWRWAFVGANASTTTVQAAQTDLSDTTLGFVGTATPTIEITVAFEQVD